MTEIEQRIYNCWLAATRSACGKPFKLRKNWKNAEETIDYKSIKKLAKMFKRYDNIDINEWFKAPYETYPDTKIQYDLKFYTLMKAYSCYRLKKTKFKNLTNEQFHKTLFKNNKKTS